MLVKNPATTRRATAARRSSSSRLVPKNPPLTSLVTTTSPPRGARPGFGAPVGSAALSVGFVAPAGRPAPVFQYVDADLQVHEQQPGLGPETPDHLPILASAPMA